MSYFISFICGAVLFHSSRVFPFISLLSVLIAMGLLLVRNGLARSGLVRLIPIAIIAVSGFYYARLSYVPLPSVADICGTTIEIQGVARSEAMPINPESGVFSQIMEVKKAMDSNSRPLVLRELRLIGDGALTVGTAYNARVNINKDACLQNPGSNRKALSGYIVELREGNSPGAGFFAKSRLRLNAFLKNSFSAGPAGFLMSGIFSK